MFYLMTCVNCLNFNDNYSDNYSIILRNVRDGGKNNISISGGTTSVGWLNSY